MLADLPVSVVLAWWTLTGLVVGSFLNVCIHRLPLEGESVNKPRRSRCPSSR
jgi:prepilin signal peptidase PulO-like enzyme (type II secretory pathway)